ncbi:polymorphic toxin-type HINT domain-containing protein, partial [Streptomyces tendae]|uniref:polymorphic toxin-type HINT domain-containing protein n=1 Tax=Streptomyces tendae TaxID=1932 RepID=UPI003D71B226
PYGAPRGTAPTFWPGQKGFVNGDIDPTTGLTHIGARDYDPTTGRFISVDPLLELDKPQTIGGYAYSAHNPTTYSDPTGTRLGGCEGGWQECGPGGNGGDTDNGPLVEDTDTGGLGSGGGTGSGTGSGGNSGGGEDCGWLTRCGWSHAVDDVKEWASENKAVIGGVVTEVVVGGLCYSTAVGAGLATGGVGVAASAGCGGLASAAGSAVSNALTPDADHSATGQLKEQFDAAAWGAASSVVGYGIGSKINPCHSFLPGTGVLMADGTQKTIEDIEVGDTVVTTDVTSGKTTEKKVVDTITTEDDKNFTELTVATDDEPSVIVATDTHPFWVVDRHEWIDARNIRPGHLLRTSAGTHVQVTAVSHYTKRQRTHDLTIDDIHAYYVLAGATPVLVHNCGGALLDRARGLYATRADEASTVAVARVRNVKTGRSETWVATERSGLPDEWRAGNAPLRGERYIPGQGHAEATIMNRLGSDWKITGMASSTRMCHACFAQATGPRVGLTPSPIGKGAGVSSSGNTPWRVVVGGGG